MNVPAVLEVDEIGEELQVAGIEHASRPSRNKRRNRRERTRTGKKKLGRHESSVRRSGEMPPPGTMQWTWGWWSRFCPQVCSTAVMPISAPRCFGSVAMVVSVSAVALNRRP